MHVAPTNAVRPPSSVEKPPRQARATPEPTPEEQAAIAELRSRDAEVRAHEAAHAAVAGGTPTYSFRRGPDGRQYAVGGEVQIDASGGSSPQETIAKMQRVRAAALAPANPSGQDRSVASHAAQRETEARAELARQRAEEQQAKQAPAERPAAGADDEVASTREAATTTEERGRGAGELREGDGPGRARRMGASGLPIPEGHQHGDEVCPNCSAKIDRFAANA